MHPYATDSNERKLIPNLTAVLGVLAALALDRGLTYISLTVWWWFDAPAVIGFSGIFYIAFDKWAWKWGILQRIGLVKLPNLNGTWKGYGISSFDQHDESFEAAFTIHQSWSRISVAGRFGASNSHSVIGSVLIDDARGVVLSYDFISEPHADAEDTMQIHRGTAILILQPDGVKISGDYYTGRGRENYGRLELEKE